MSRKIEIPNLDDLLRRYVAGKPEQKLAREAGVNRWTFRRRLIAANIKPRNVSDSMYIRWANASADDRTRMLDNAHAATRGRTVSTSEKHRRALGKERSCSHTSPTENVLAIDMRAMGFSVIQQKAVGIYNVDVALDISSVAVEVFGGGWHSCGHHAKRFFERTVYLLDHGWHVVIIWVDSRRYPLGRGAVQYLVSFCQELSRNPSSLRQYRMILGNGKDAPVCKSHFNRPADIERLCCRNNAAGGYNFVSR